MEVYGAISLSKLYQAMFTRLKPTSKYFGVSWLNGWRCHVVQNGKRRLLAKFDNEEDAAKAYNEFMGAIYGKYCNLNNI